jgi:hypothetical protein
MSQTPTPAGAATERPPSLLNLVFEKIVAVVLSSSALFAILGIVAAVAWKVYQKKTLPFVIWAGVLVAGDLVLSLVAALTADRRSGWTAPERQRLIALVSLGLLGLCVAGVGLTLPFAHTDVFGSPLRVWREHMGLVLLVGGLQLAGFFLIVFALQFGREVSRQYPNLRRPVAAYNAIAGALLLVCILVIANLLPYIQFAPFSSLNQTYDWTTSRLFTLEPDSKSVLADLKEPVKVYILLPANTEEAKSTEMLLANARRVTPQISSELVSPNLNPERFMMLQEKYQFTSMGLLVEYGTEPKVSHEFIRAQDLMEREHSEKGRLLYKGETALINALKYLSEGKSKIILYFTQGHGELALGGPRMPGMEEDNPRLSLDMLREDLEKRNYQFKSLNLAKETRVPEDAGIVVIAGPRRLFSDEALKALRDYLDGKDRPKKGRVVVLMPPAADRKGNPITTGLERFLAGYQVQVGKDRVMTLDSQVGSPLVVNGVMNRGTTTSNPITKAFAANIAFPFDDFRSVTPMPSNPGAPGGYTAETIIRTDPEDRVWKETTVEANPIELFKDLVRNHLKELEKKIKETDPVSLAVAVSEGAPPMPPMPGHPPIPGNSVPRLVVFGGANWLTNTWLSTQYGPFLLDLFNSSGSWLREKPSMGSSATSKERNQFSLPPSADPWHLVLLPITMALIAVVMLGGAVWIVRRR